MSARPTKSKKSSSTRGRVKVDKEENEDKSNLISREETKERSHVWGIKIPLGLDRDPIALRASAKKDEPSDDSGGIKRDDEKPTSIKSEDTKLQHTRREVNSKLSPTRLWEHHPDGQPYIPRPSPVRKKFESIVNDLDVSFGQEDLDQGQELPPPPPPPPQPQSQPQLQPSPQPQRQAQRRYRDVRVLPEVEVLLPRWEDVRRQKVARAVQARRERRQPRGAPRADQAARQNSVFIKPEPEDVKPLLALEEHDPAEAREVLRTAVQNLRNPDVKVKKDLLLSDEFLLDALTWEGINYKYPIPLPKEVAEFQLHRKYISHLYGGSSQAVSPRLKKEKLEWHGLNDWTFLRLDYNPHAPTRPGHSGLFFKSYRASEGDEDEIRRTFIRVASGKWVYMGQYKFEAGISLSTEAWKQQKPAVRRAWAKGILEKDFGEYNCVTVWLRKRGGADYKITEEEITEKLTTRFDYIRANLTEEDIIGAFDRGEEEMGTYRMTCVGYDAEFIKVLARNAPKWAELEKQKQLEKQRQKELEAEQEGAPRGQPKRKGKGMGSKRKPIEIESDSGLEDGDAEREVKAGSDDSYQGTSAGLADSSTGRPRRAAAMFKRQRTS